MNGSAGRSAEEGAESSQSQESSEMGAAAERLERRKLELRFAARGRADLLPLLDQAVGARLADRYEIRAVLAAGAERFVFLAFDVCDRLPVVVKQPAFDYRRPEQATPQGVRRARQRLEDAWRLLESARGDGLPHGLAKLHAPHLVPVARRTAVWGPVETYVVEQRLDATPLRRLALEVWRDATTAQRESHCRSIAGQFVELWRALSDRGWLYTDVGPDNLALDRRGMLRLFDAGGAVEASAEVRGFPATPAFSTPQLGEVAAGRRTARGDLSLVLPSLAKLLHFLLTRVEPLNYLPPDLTHPRLADVAQVAVRCLADLLAVDAEPDRLSDALRSLDAWRAADDPVERPSAPS